MAILDDAQLLLKKIAVTVIIYAVPVTILTGGLLLTKHLLGGDEPAPVVIQPKIESKTNETKPQ